MHNADAEYKNLEQEENDWYSKIEMSDGEF